MDERAPYELSRTIEMRWANPENYGGHRGAGGKTNFGRKGSPCRGRIKTGETWVLAEGQGMGTIRRIWVTLADRGHKMLRGLVLRMYWDGAAKPAVECPLGDFFGNSLGRQFVFSNTYFNNPEARNWNCMVPMPFRTGFKITVTNESPLDNDMFWYHIDYTLGDAHSDDAAYFHTYWNRENPTTLRRDFKILPNVTGRGRYLGCTMGLITRPYYATWWGEGEVKIYLDGDTEFPTLCGTGTEDYICTAWGTGSYSLPWYGCQFLRSADSDRQQVSMYRLHGPDPVYFQRSCRVELQQIGFWGGENSMNQLDRHGQPGVLKAGDGEGFVTMDQIRAHSPVALFEREDDWCAAAYFYLDRPTSELPPIAPYADRVADLTGDPTEFECATAELAKKLIALPAQDDMVARVEAMEPPQAMKYATRLMNDQGGLVALVDRVAAMAAGAKGEQAAAANELLAKVEASGIAKPAYQKRLMKFLEALPSDPRQPITVRQFVASDLQPAAKNIAKAELPAKDACYKAVPFVPETELADIRAIHQEKDGLVYLQAELKLPAASEGRLAYGADGPIKAWLNGTQIDCRPDATNPAVIGEYVVPASWKKGVNMLTFAINTNGGKAWGIVVRATRA